MIVLNCFVFVHPKLASFHVPFFCFCCSSSPPPPICCLIIVGVFARRIGVPGDEWGLLLLDDGLDVVADWVGLLGGGWPSEGRRKRIEPLAE
jgi:hypothetical protein